MSNVPELPPLPPDLVCAYGQPGAASPQVTSESDGEVEGGAVRRGLGKKTVAMWQAIGEMLELERYRDVKVTSRQIAYQLVGKPWQAIENVESDKQRVGRIIVDMRRKGAIPYSRITDRSRRKRFVSSWEDAKEYIDAGAYRQNMWTDQPVIPMIACEKQALEGIFDEVCGEYGLSPWIIRGFNAESFDYEWSEAIKEITALGKRVVIAYFGDWDPSGLCIEEVSHAKLGDGERKYGFSKEPFEGFGATFTWERLGLVQEDFDRFGIATVPIKMPKVIDGKLRKGDPRAKVFLNNFGQQAAELDALPPDELERRIRQFIERYIDKDLWKRTKRVEAAQRASLKIVTDNWNVSLAAAQRASKRR